jgi:hypothetical protein
LVLVELSKLAVLILYSAQSLQQVVVAEDTLTSIQRLMVALVVALVVQQELITD